MLLPRATHCCPLSTIFAAECRLEGILYGGFKGELWMKPGREPTQVLTPSLTLCLQRFANRCIMSSSSLKLCKELAG